MPTKHHPHPASSPSALRIRRGPTSTLARALLVELPVVVSENEARAVASRRAALATADWAIRTGASALELLDMLAALGISRGDFPATPNEPDRSLASRHIELP